VAFSFGLLHGFGFASALLETGLPRHDLPAAPLLFNAGVEVGQLAFITLILGLAMALRRAAVPESLWRQKLPPFAIGSVAAFWTIERIAAFWG